MPQPKEIMESFITGVYRQAKLETLAELRELGEAGRLYSAEDFTRPYTLTEAADELEKRLKERIEKGEV